MKKLLIFVFAFILSGCASATPDAVFQYSAISAFMQGDYEGQARFADIKQRGDFGLGTFNGINGELVALDGKFYQIKSDGKVNFVGDEMLSPFVQVKFFRPDQKAAIDKEMSLAELESFLDAMIKTKNLFFAIKIEGEFSFVKARSIGRQAKPYRSFLETVKEQRVFEFNQVKGVLVGFFSPDYFPQISPSRYHFHFLNADRKSGGHLLDCRIKNGLVWIDRAGALNLALPEDKEFLGMDLKLDSGAYK